MNIKKSIISLALAFALLIPLGIENVSAVEAEEPIIGGSFIDSSRTNGYTNKTSISMSVQVGSDLDTDALASVVVSYIGAGGAVQSFTLNGKDTQGNNIKNYHLRFETANKANVVDNSRVYVYGVAGDISVTATSVSGLSSSKTVLLDITAPTITATTTQNQFQIADSQSRVGRVLVDGVVKYSYGKHNDQSILINIPDTSKVHKIEAYDKCGNKSQLSVTVDGTTPVFKNYLKTSSIYLRDRNILVASDCAVKNNKLVNGTGTGIKRIDWARYNDDGTLGEFTTVKGNRLNVGVKKNGAINTKGKYAVVIYDKCSSDLNACNKKEYTLYYEKVKPYAVYTKDGIQAKVKNGGTVKKGSVISCKDDLAGVKNYTLSTKIKVNNSKKTKWSIVKNPNLGNLGEGSYKLDITDKCGNKTSLQFKVIK